MLPRSARYMIVSAFAFSVMTLFVKLVGERLPPQEIVAARAAITLVLSYIALRRAGVPPLGSRRPLLLLRGLFGFMSLSCIYYAVTRIPLAEATVLQYLHPPFTALLGALVLGERVRAGTFASIALGLCGLLVIVEPRALLIGTAQELPTLAVLAGVGGAVFSACAYVTVRKLGEREHPLVIVFYFPLVALPASLPMMWRDAVLPTPTEWLLLLGVGLSTQIGQVAITRGLQLDDAGRAATYSYLQVPLAALWGALVFGALPGPSTVAGAALILLGAILSVRASRAHELGIARKP